MQLNIMIYGLFRKSVKLTFLLDNIYIRNESTLYRQLIGVPMGINRVRLIADQFLLLCCLSDDNESEVIEAFNSTSRDLDDLLNIDNTFFDNMVNHI